MTSEFTSDFNVSRRQFLEQFGLGFGGLALTQLLAQDGLLAKAPSTTSKAHSIDLTPKTWNFPVQAKAIIQLFHHGGPSQMDLFDPKPELQKRGGEKYAKKFESFQPGSESNQLMASPFKFSRYGESGMDFSELVPHLGSVADDLCMVRSMYSEHNNHPQGMFMINTGKTFGGRPSLGAWVSYGLGTENQNLPAYVVLRDPEGYNNGGTRFWTNGWLPALYRGTEFSSRGAPVLNLRPGVDLPNGAQRNNLDLLAKLNEERRKRYPLDSRLDARLRHYELAARMQLSAPEALDISSEPARIKALYGVNESSRGFADKINIPEEVDYFGRKCLIARRLLERGVRFVQIWSGNDNSFPRRNWDSHENVERDHEPLALGMSVGAAALIKDLKQRGMLEDTLILWTTEFGRMPCAQSVGGRDHNPFGFTNWLAGGGIRGGVSFGPSDEWGYKPLARGHPTTVHDVHATILHLLGVDHERLTVRHNGIDRRLTDVHGHVLDDIVA